jgi:hypothetical protein
VRLLPRRRPAAALRLEPAGRPLRATEAVTAIVTLDEALDGVTSARVELGYVNRYAYRWAGRREALMRSDDSSLLTAGMVGTDYGSDRETEDWVAVLDQPLTGAGGVLAAGTHTAALRLPSWAPGSSERAVTWQVRLRVERNGRDAEVEAPFAVLVAAPDPPPQEPPLERLSGDACDIDLVTGGPCFRTGAPLYGTLRITPKEAVPPADVAVMLQAVWISHPLTRTPALPRELLVRPVVTLDKRLDLTAGVTVELPFAIDVPADADPTTAAVHCSLAWWVQARIMYAGFSGPSLERVQRAVVIHTA